MDLDPIYHPSRNHLLPILTLILILIPIIATQDLLPLPTPNIPTTLLRCQVIIWTIPETTLAIRFLHSLHYNIHNRDISILPSLLWWAIMRSNNNKKWPFLTHIKYLLLPWLIIIHIRIATPIGPLPSQLFLPATLLQNSLLGMYRIILLSTTTKMPIPKQMLNRMFQ